MKTFFKIFGILVLVLAAGVTFFLIYFNSTYPEVGPPEEITVEITPERLERGKYLANHVSSCIDCHSDRDWQYFSGPVVVGTEGMGGTNFGEELKLPGTIYTKNITPAALKDWTDGDIMKAITSGINKNNKVLFPIMPYPKYHKMDHEDLYSIIAYIRTLKPIENEVSESSINFPVNLIIKTVPQPYNTVVKPDISDIIKYGEYMTTIAACEDCHTPSKEGEPIDGMYYAGGMEFELPMGTVRAVNITPDKETGIGSWTEEIFVNRFKSFDPDSVGFIPVNDGEFNTPMPWALYAGMTEDDLKAIYAYLMSVQPVKHAVNRFSPPNKY